MSVFRCPQCGHEWRQPKEGYNGALKPFLERVVAMGKDGRTLDEITDYLLKRDADLFLSQDYETISSNRQRIKAAARQALRSHGIAIPQGVANDVRREKARARRALIVQQHDEQGMLFKEIAQVLGICTQRAHQLYRLEKRIRDERHGPAPQAAKGFATTSKEEEDDND
jgi:cobalamin biosynthesis protein CbiG